MSHVQFKGEPATSKSEASVEVTTGNINDSQQFYSKARGHYEFWSRVPLSDGVANTLLALVREKGERASDRDGSSILGGRAASRGVEVPELGNVFIKKYAHGGLLRAFTASRFIAFGACRSQQEFLMLEKVRSLGIRAPKPLVFVKKGALLYSTWLIMEEVRNVRNLVEISISEPDALRDFVLHAGEQVGLLIKNRILHIDLHPGNILVDGEGQTHIVDFDKARTFKGSAWQLRDMYLRRWRRAVIKHRLSPLLAEHMSLSLRSYHE